MITPFAHVRALSFAVLIAPLAVADVAWCQASQKNVLMLSEFRPEQTAYLFEPIRRGIEAEFKQRLNYFTEYLDVQTFGAEDYHFALRDLFSRKYRNQRLDLVIAFGRPAAEFVRVHGQEVFPGAAILAVLALGNGEEMLDDWPATAAVTGVIDGVDPKGTLEFILQLQPDTKRVVIIVGGGRSGTDYLERRARRELAGYERALELTYWVGLPLETLLARVATLGPGTSVLYLRVNEDMTGRRFVTDDVLESVTRLATVPVYGLLSRQLARGIVGGNLRDFETNATVITNKALQILRGARARDLPLRDTPAFVPMANWHQLRRWTLSESRLPRGTIVQYRDPSLWQSYRWHVIGGLSVITAQMALIAWLLVEYRRRRRRAEVEVGQRLQDSRTQLVTIAHLDRRAAMGEVTAAITHELNQPLEAILHNAEAGELMLESGVSSPEEIGHIFADIRRIDTRAAEIIQRLRGLLRKKDLETQPLDANELTRDTTALVAPVASAKGVRVELDLRTQMISMVGDRIHLQQVLLNVLLNGIDAMSATPREQRRLTVRTFMVDHRVEISVRDYGHGIRAERASQIFEPFYTTKGEGMGLGLSIARTIIEAHGGSIDARNNTDGGATVWFTLPSADATDGPLAPRSDRNSCTSLLDDGLPMSLEPHEPLRKPATLPLSPPPSWPSTRRRSERPFTKVQ